VHADLLEEGAKAAPLAERQRRSVTFQAILVLAVGLAAVSPARGLSVPVIRRRHVFSVVLLFLGFQALMPLVAGGRFGAPSARGSMSWVGSC
jgi:hypothetical protein